MNIYVDLIFNYTLILRRALFRYNFRIRSGPAAKKSQNFSQIPKLACGVGLKFKSHKFYSHLYDMSSMIKPIMKH